MQRKYRKILHMESDNEELNGKNGSSILQTIYQFTTKIEKLIIKTLHTQLQLQLSQSFHCCLLLDHLPKAHSHRTDAGFHTFFSTAEPFAWIFCNQALVSPPLFLKQQNLVAEKEPNKVRFRKVSSIQRIKIIQ